MLESTRDDRLTRQDWLLMTGLCLLFFGFSLIGGRPLTMHEGVLPQTAREMTADHDWVIPKNGGRPWLESPPLPQWITVGIASLIGHCDEIWIVRIGPALMGTICVLLVAWMASHFFGRWIGLLAAAVHATTYELAQYAWQAEDEIFLCAIVTAAVSCFVWIEFVRKDSSAPGSRNFFGARPWSLLALFILLGMTNLAKGLLFGMVMSLVPIATFLLWNNDWRRTTFYFWLPGWIVNALIAVAWPYAAYQRFPDVVELWLYDHQGRLDGAYADITQPWYYYAKLLPNILAPWIAVVPVALAMTWRSALQQRFSAERFLWCWAIFVPLVFSIPSGKHHHYLLHAVTPWSILAASVLPRLHAGLLSWPARLRTPSLAALTIGLPLVVVLWCLKKKLGWTSEPLLISSAVLPCLAVLFSWGLNQKDGRIASGTLFTAVAAMFLVGHWLAGQSFDQSRHDARFLTQVREFIGTDKPLVIDGQSESLDEFRIQFSQSDRARLVHNLSFLRDAALTSPELYVITRARHEAELKEFGTPELVLRSEKTRREKSTGDRWALFRLQVKPDLERVAADHLRVSPMQAMQRASGPFLEPMRR